MRDNGRTVVFVAYDMGALNHFCHGMLLLGRTQPSTSAVGPV
jgi:hypothetical protein